MRVPVLRNPPPVPVSIPRNPEPVPVSIPTNPEPVPGSAPRDPNLARVPLLSTHSDLSPNERKNLSKHSSVFKNAQKRIVK